jgi:hypothetical protein
MTSLNSNTRIKQRPGEQLVIWLTIVASCLAVIAIMNPVDYFSPEMRLGISVIFLFIPIFFGWMLAKKLR